MISIVCPVFNEEGNLPELCRRLKLIAQTLGRPYEIIFVDDGSRDGSLACLKIEAAANPSIRILELDRNYGMTTPLYAGLLAAKGEFIATLDADLQNPPEEFPRLFEMMADADMVTGYRAKRNDPWLKRASSQVARRIRRAVIGDTIEDVGCSLRIFRREVLRCFPPYKGMHRFFPALAELEGFRIKQVPVRHDARAHGKSKYGFANRLLGPLWDLFSVRWMLKRKITYGVKNAQ